MGSMIRLNAWPYWPWYKWVLAGFVFVLLDCLVAFAIVAGLWVSVYGSAFGQVRDIPGPGSCGPMTSVQEWFDRSSAKRVQNGWFEAYSPEGTFLENRGAQTWVSQDRWAWVVTRVIEDSEYDPKTQTHNPVQITFACFEQAGDNGDTP